MLLTILANVVQVAPVTPPIPPSPPSGGGGQFVGGGGTHYPRSRYSYEEQEEDKRKDKIKKNNRFILEFLKTATDIINNQ